MAIQVEAMGNWHKGALTSNFMHWLVDLLGDVRGEPGGLLVQCRAATYRMNAMFSLLYRAGAFLSEQECSFVSEQGLQFLKTYSMLAGTYVWGQQTVDVSPLPEATYVSSSDAGDQVSWQFRENSSQPDDVRMPDG